MVSWNVTTLRTGSRFLLGIATCVLCTPALAGAVAATNQIDAFLRFAKESVPNKGTIIATIEPESDTTFGRVTYAFDFSTRAWFMATQEHAWGRDPRGNGVYVSNAASAHAERLESEWQSSPITVSTVFLQARLAYHAENPGLIQSAELDDDGNWIVASRAPAGAEGMDGVTLYAEFDRDGILVRSWRDNPRDPRDRSYEASPDSPPGYPLSVPRSTRSSKRTYTHVEVIPDGNPELFYADNIAQVAYDNRALYEMDMQAAGHGARFGSGATTGSSPADVIPHAGQGLAQYRWPLIIGGGVVILIALLEVVRRRK